MTTKISKDGIEETPSLVAAHHKLTRADLNRVALRSCGLEWDWNYERQMNMGFCYCMLPVIEKLYDTPEDRSIAMQRHMEFFNTTPHLATLIFGITAAMEEQNAADAAFDTESINNVKISLMGPLAGIGDSFIWGTLRIIATGVGVSLAAQGNVLGPLLFLLLFNIPAQGLRFWLMHVGYKLGSGFLQKIQESGLMTTLTYGASVLGLMVIGSMTAENVSITVPLTIGSGDAVTSLGEIVNTIMPGLLPLSFTLLLYWLVSKKQVKTTTLLVVLVGIGLVGSYFGILAAE
ncbi:PTS system mannose/fructose/sorbose family transporter subunit IID [Collinsella sp. zg1085]|uniref:PTS system mannose/fructose/sorbose family transporter subunit IID n=1 Tax=Collinsella sp. zg1085 TaxID=2844380 RepID=UPI001C0DC5AF|nr:PTS system mannose/fructose/sorbose family transporter subunit IID [Collinsella sp. zg1085]QWT18025.1 PTS system mannose/fructose/sorbose family transporter subunit IID [Collinsella sp. zg1085]